MKILHLNWAGLRGGTETFTLALAKQQKLVGLDVAICYMSEKAELGHLASQFGIDVIELHMRNGLDLYNLFKLLPYIQKKNVNIIHNHNGSPFVCLFKLRLPALRLIQHFHSTTIKATVSCKCSDNPIKVYLFFI